MVEQTVTSSKSNSLGEHAALIASLQLIGTLIPLTHVYGSTANVQANPTPASQFIALRGTINVAEDTSGLISSFDISSLGRATETQIRTKNGPSVLFWRIEETSIISSKTTTDEMPIIPLDEELSPEDREAREKGLALAARIEHLYRTDEGFRRWYHEGIDEIEAGHFVTFSEDGWKEE